jgi:ABC-type cobalamin/Fe3+-siderophores transport system ATPase subunit
MVNNNYKRGSEWRKWDLHVHAPSIYTCAKNNQFVGLDLEDKQSKFIKEIKNLQDISVLGITDYFSLDGYKKVIEYEKSIQNIDLILPNIELRLTPETKNGKKINIHIIPDIKKITTDKIDEFLHKFELKQEGENHTCKKESLIELGKKLDSTLSDEEAFVRGLNEFSITYQKFFEVFNEQDDKFKSSILIGVSNSNNDGASGIKDFQAIRNLIYEGVHFIFSSNIIDREYFLGKRTDSAEKIIKKYYSLMPCIHGSDYHGSKSGKVLCLPDKDRYCWIKADPTFEGLKQIIYEPGDRVRIKSIKPGNVHNVYCIDYVEYTLNGEKKKIHFNPFLNSIIGIRASGKSTLLKSIVKNVDVDEFNDKEEEPGNIFTMSNFRVCWGDKKEDEKTVLYIPQNFLSKLVHDTDETKNELKKFIKKLFEKNEEFNNLLSVWRKSNEIISNKISQIVSDILNIDEGLSRNKQDAKNEGGEEGVVSKIKILKGDIEKTREKSKFTKEDLGKFNQLQKDFDTKNEELEVLERDKKSLEFLKELDIIDKNILNDIQLSGKVQEKLEKQLSAKQESIGMFLAKEIIVLDKAFKEKTKSLKEIEKNMIDYKEKLKEERLLKELSEGLTQQEKKLRKIQRLNKEIKEMKENRENKRLELAIIYKKREESIDKLIKDFKSFGKKFEFIDIKLEKIFKINDIIELRRPFSLSNSKNKSKYELVKFLENQKEIPNDFTEAVLEIVDGIICKDIQLRKGEDKKSFINRLLENHYDVNYQNAVRDKKDGAKLLEMSDGQKMNALLELLFSFDDSSFPILIDQPEDDLDVTAITKHVSKFIRDKKRKRQIIIVSHNANLVVGSDTENVIIANKKTNKGSVEGFIYQNGAIENEKIRSEMIEILEGGEDAFNKRREKLEIKSHMR